MPGGPCCASISRTRGAGSWRGTRRGPTRPTATAPSTSAGPRSRAVRALQAGVPAERSGSRLPQGLGNGSLMRILPVALAAAGERREPRGAGVGSLRRHPRRAPGPRGVRPVRPPGAPRCSTARAIPAPPWRGRAGRWSASRQVATSTARSRSSWRGTRRTGSGHVADAFWSAWDAASSARSYADAVVRAVRFGNDTDTTAAIAGGLAGIRWGIAGIPHDWLAGMRGRAIVGELLDRLLAEAGWRTSTTSPLRVDWVPLDAFPGLAAGGGALGMTLLPGKRRRGYSGPHWRDAAADALLLRDVHGCTTLLLLVEDVDLEMSRAWDTIPALEAAGIRVIRHPVRDMDVPRDRVAFRATLDDILARLRAGEHVVVVCRGGLGRTGTAAACMLVEGGASAAEAIRLVRAARPGTVERASQEAFIEDWERWRARG